MILGQIKESEIGGHVARMDKVRNAWAYEILVGKPERLRYEDIIKMYVKGIGCAGMDWIHLPQIMDH
jgi:hypothetical protein